MVNIISYENEECIFILLERDKYKCSTMAENTMKLVFSLKLNESSKEIIKFLSENLNTKVLVDDGNSVFILPVEKVIDYSIISKPLEGYNGQFFDMVDSSKHFNRKIKIKNII